jgi:hypothetical protein
MLKRAGREYQKMIHARKSKNAATRAPDKAVWPPVPLETKAERELEKTKASGRERNIVSARLPKKRIQ